MKPGVRGCAIWISIAMTNVVMAGRSDARSIGRIVRSVSAAIANGNGLSQISTVDSLAKLGRIMNVATQVSKGHVDIEGKRRLVGGQKTGEVPAVGAIMNRVRVHCTGTAVAPRVVVTAAHCLQGYNKDELSFAIGPNAWKPSKSFSVADIVVHPSYDKTKFGVADVGVMVLRDVFTGPLVKIPNSGDMDAAKKVGESFGITFLGYGYAWVRDDGAMGDLGFKVKAAIGVAKWLEETIEYNAGRGMTCNGDSGGPALLQTPAGDDILVAISSWGDSLCREFGVSMRADKYAVWIREQIVKSGAVPGGS